MGYVNAQIKVFNGGNVSLGSTLTPATGCRFQVVGNSVFTENTFLIESSAFIKGQNKYSTAAAPDYTWYNNLNTGMFHRSPNTISFSNNGVESIRLLPSGNISIGSVTDYGYKLLVNAGDQPSIISCVDHQSDWKYSQVAYVNRRNSKGLAVLYNLDEKFKVYGNGDVWAYGYYTGSDILLKENITPINNALEKVLKLKGMNYNYIPEVLKDPNDTITVISTDPPKLLIGLIAEDVERVVPEVVRTFEDGLKGISYGNLVALLIEAIKEQEIKISELQESLNAYILDSVANQKRNSGLGIGNQLIEEKTDIDNQNMDNNDPILFQNVPNPFNEVTRIEYFLPEKALSSSIMIFDLQGTLIKTFSFLTPGHHHIAISAKELMPGMYLYSLIFEGREIDTKKMILTK